MKSKKLPTKGRRVELWITEERYQQLRSIARRDHISVRSLIIDCIREWIPAREDCVWEEPIDPKTMATAGAKKETLQ